MIFCRIRLRKYCTARRVVALGLWLFAIALLLLALMFFVPTRNLLLGPILPGMWREIPTRDLLYYKMVVPSEYDVGSCPKSCTHKVKPKTLRSDLDNRKISFYDNLKVDANSEPKPEWHFWPTLTREEKKSMMYNLDVVIEILHNLEAEYFFVGGSLLGAVRHRGVIPWDDDLDLAVNVKDWRKVKEALCCLEGFTLRLRNSMHWKVFEDSGAAIRTLPAYRFPFVDIFFYETDDTYIWAVPDFVKVSVLCKKSDVYPLRMATFEDKLYPVPKEAEKVIQKEFGGIDMCVSPNHLHRFNRPLDSKDVVALKCDRLKHIYPIYKSLE